MIRDGKNVVQCSYIECITQSHECKENETSLLQRHTQAINKTSKNGSSVSFEQTEN